MIDPCTCSSPRGDSSGVSRPSSLGVWIGASRVAAVGAIALAVGCSATGSNDRARMTSSALRSPDSPEFRTPETLDRDSIFSPLDLPAPSPKRIAAGVPGPEYWQQRADYVIAAELDDKANAVHGRQIITYTNNSPDTLPFLWLHLEQNYFKDDSIGNLRREEGGRFGNRGGFDGGFTIRSMRELPATGTTSGSIADVTAPARPDSSWFDEPSPARLSDAIRNPPQVPESAQLRRAIHDTLCRIDPASPLPPGGVFRFEIAWSFRIPEYGADRLGIDPTEFGLIYQLAQWFPAVATYDDVHGWNTLGYLGTGEFYTNFGDYDVKLVTPRSHITAATGVLRNPADVLTPTQLERLNRAKSSDQTVVIRDESEVTDPASRPAGDGPLTWHFTADDVRTFAWTSSSAFIWDASFIPARGRSPADDRPDPARRPPGGTLVQSVYPKEALPLWSRSTHMLRSAIEGYNARWFEYPYPSAINVNGRAGGMEYPMIIFCRERVNERGLFGVTTHEIGHNWFPMIVNTDEKRHAWMDEGFNSFINYYSNAEFWKEPPGGRGDASAFARTMLEPEQQPMDTPADHIREGRLGTLNYAKPAVMLVLLREVVLGEERFDAAFRHYIRSWAFKSPRPADFIRCMENAAGADLSWFWRGWIFGTGYLDHAVASAEFDVPSQTCRVVFENRAELVMPMTYRVTYDDGSTEDRRLPVEAWFTKNRFTASWKSVTSAGSPKRPVRVEIDPNRRLPDVDRANNVWGAGGSGSGGGGVATEAASKR